MILSQSRYLRYFSFTILYVAQGFPFGLVTVALPAFLLERLCVRECRGDLAVSDICESCGARATLRPHVVWFGETPLFLNEIDMALRDAALFAAIGTSGLVYPAAGLVNHAEMFGVPTIEFNLEETAASRAFDETRPGKAGETVPKWVEEVISSP